MDPWTLVQLMALAGPALQSVGPTQPSRTKMGAEAAANALNRMGGMLGAQAQGLIGVKKAQNQSKLAEQWTEKDKIAAERMRAENDLMDEIKRSFASGGQPMMGGPLQSITAGIPGMGGQQTGQPAGLGGPSPMEMAKYMMLSGNPQGAASIMYPSQAFARKAGPGTMIGLTNPVLGDQSISYMPPPAPSLWDILPGEGTPPPGAGEAALSPEDQKYKVGAGAIAGQALKSLGGGIVGLMGDIWSGSKSAAQALTADARRRVEAADAAKAALQSGDRQRMVDIYQLYQDVLDGAMKRRLRAAIDSM